MRAYLSGFAGVYAAGVLVVVLTDDAARANNPWVVSFVMACLAAPIAAGWLGAEIARSVLRRRVLEPGRSAAWRRCVRGIVAGLAGVLGGVVLANAVALPWESDAWTMAIVAFPAALIGASIGRRSRAGMCWRCGYDLRGLTSAAGGRCPECGEAVSDAAPAAVDAGRRAAA